MVLSTAQSSIQDSIQKSVALKEINLDNDDKIKMFLNEYAEGGTLQQYLKINRLSWSENINLCVQLIKGVAYLHNIMLAHLDLHSKNILIHYGNIKIADFGSSKILNNKMSTNNEAFDPVTLRLEISKDGLREKPVNGTPLQYIKLYSECWHETPSKRPTAKNILKKLEFLEYNPVFLNVSPN
ncbi:17157_t:CDS:2 [Cetraspora pellucida]|uniref:17157_t:CDS:1 n=1 Tax=Cetraspora pellucida TaxID=1433469 RepID=A0ACA9NB79_9GLOM|nr:17157_t:CDS:2 [Cetraspora pellucida]